ncbi:hypothetical protein [Geothrix terrae]|uniref:hypothetical protein n=1 Tax=Geothrix terrae TaxID=2922720 RepID=UPI001FACDEED|nr:hypothetical protein [Geothrix terrae]
MSRTTTPTLPVLMTRAAWWAFSVLMLTSIHHAYGAIRYATPWRMHVTLVSVVTIGILFGARHVAWQQRGWATSSLAFWIFVGTALIVPVFVIGLFEGGYNHFVKDALYMSGAPAGLMRRLFPPPAYELPNDVFFEATGVLQVIPALLTGAALIRLVRKWRGDVHAWGSR